MAVIELINAAFGRLGLFDLVLLALASWSLANMLSRESGPWGIFTQFRARWPLGGLTPCIYCMVRWIAPILTIIHLITPVFTWLLAVGGLALMLRSYTGVGHDV